MLSSYGQLRRFIFDDCRGTSTKFVKAKNSDYSFTCLDLGCIFVLDDHKQAFWNAYWNDIKTGKQHYLCEKHSDSYDDYVMLFLELDYKFQSSDAVEAFRLPHFAFTIARHALYLVDALMPSVRNRSVRVLVERPDGDFFKQDDPPPKQGAHIRFYGVYMQLKHMKTFVDLLFVHLSHHLPDFLLENGIESTWKDTIDTAPYNKKGSLRMVGSYKTMPCPEEGSHSRQLCRCRGSKVVHVDKRYMPACVAEYDRCSNYVRVTEVGEVPIVEESLRSDMAHEIPIDEFNILDTSLRPPKDAHLSLLSLQDVRIVSTFQPVNTYEPPADKQCTHLWDSRSMDEGDAYIENVVAPIVNGHRVKFMYNETPFWSTSSVPSYKAHPWSNLRPSSVSVERMSIQPRTVTSPGNDRRRNSNTYGLFLDEFKRTTGCCVMTIKMQKPSTFDITAEEKMCMLKSSENRNQPQYHSSSTITFRTAFPLNTENPNTSFLRTFAGMMSSETSTCGWFMIQTCYSRKCREQKSKKNDRYIIKLGFDQLCLLWYPFLSSRYPDKFVLNETTAVHPGVSRDNNCTARQSVEVQDVVSKLYGLSLHEDDTQSEEMRKIFIYNDFIRF